MKKILAAIAAFGFSALTFASGDMFVAKPTNYFDGFYAGIGGGVSHTTAGASANITSDYQYDVSLPTRTAGAIDQNAPYETRSLDLDANLGDIMAAGEIFAGFGKSFNIKSNRNNFYLGLEFFGKYTPTDMEASVNANSTEASTNTSLYKAGAAPATSMLFSEGLNATLENNYSFGGAIRFGYLVTSRTMIYVLAGVDVGEFEYSLKANTSMPYWNVQSDEAGSLNNGISASESVWKCGFMPGVGIETMLTDRLSLRAQYVYTFWGDGGFDVGGSSSSSYSYSSLINDELVFSENATLNSTASGEADNIQRGLFTIDLTYHFNGI